MYTLKVENTRGEILELTNNETRWQVVSIDGLYPPSADITTQVLANWDGSVYQDSRVEERNITIELYINGDADKNRNYLYNYFYISKQIKLYITTESKDVYIYGYIEKINIDLFKKHQVAQIDIICPFPFFISKYTSIYKLSQNLGGFYFPFVIDKVGIEFTSFAEKREIEVFNYSEITTGVGFKIYFNGDCTNLAIYKKNGEYFKINGSFEEGDVLELSTVRGNRNLYKINVLEKENLIKQIDLGSTWLQLDPGLNKMSFLADAGAINVEIEISSFIYYEGL